MSQMPIIILEDSMERVKKFRRNFPHAEFYDTAKDCIDAMRDKTEPFVLFLDHDLGGMIYVDSKDTNTGMEVVREIERDSSLQGFIFQVIIHSCNIPAAKEMKKALDRISLFPVKQIPFIEMDL